MSDTSADETDAVRQAWGRITGWLEHHALDVFAALGGPGSPAAIDDAAARMGLRLPPELRQLLLMNDVTAGRQPPAAATLVALGCAVDLPGGGLLLGLIDIERVHSAMTNTQKGVSGDPDCLVWRREWVPITAETDGFYGNFLDTLTGCVGSWCEGTIPTEGDYPSLAVFLQVAADGMEGVTSTGTGRVRGGHGPVRTPTAARELSPDDEAMRLWARANGFHINNAGRFPSAIREAYRLATQGVVDAGQTPGNG